MLVLSKKKKKKCWFAMDDNFELYMDSLKMS
jgi:hypothetical protein